MQSRGALNNDASPPAVVVRELNDAACRALLSDRDIGRLAFVADGYPVVLPVNYAYMNGRIWIRTGHGEKFDHAPLSPVAFEIDDLQPATRTGWSVLAKGMAHWATETDGPGPAPGQPWMPGPLPVQLVIKVRHMSGRRIDRA